MEYDSAVMSGKTFEILGEANAPSIHSQQNLWLLCGGCLWIRIETLLIAWGASESKVNAPFQKPLLYRPDGRSSLAEMQGDPVPGTRDEPSAAPHHRASLTLHSLLRMTASFVCPQQRDLHFAQICLVQQIFIVRETQDHRRVGSPPQASFNTLRRRWPARPGVLLLPLRHRAWGLLLTSGVIPTACEEACEEALYLAFNTLHFSTLKHNFLS